MLVHNNYSTVIWLWFEYKLYTSISYDHIQGWPGIKIQAKKIYINTLFFSIEKLKTP